VNKSTTKGSEVLRAVLEKLGVDIVFGLPGTQNIDFYNALRESSIRSVLATNETAASFMANGYFRSSGYPGVLVTIPGPGFFYAMPGLAEAEHDSAAVIHIVITREETPQKAYSLQTTDIEAIAKPIVKSVHTIDSVSDIEGGITDAYVDAVVGEPGPVLVMIDRQALMERSSDTGNSPATAFKPVVPDRKSVSEVAALIVESKKIVIFAGQGAAGASGQLLKLAELIEAPVVTTCSGRGLIPENHRLSINIDFSIAGVKQVNELFERSDLILAVGCKFSHNGTGGFALNMPESKLVHIDASRRVLESGNYPASIAIESDTTQFLNMLMENSDELRTGTHGFSDLPRLKRRIEEERSKRLRCEPMIVGADIGNMSDLFGILNDHDLTDTIIVTDAGFHQTLTRNYIKVHRPRSLIVPSDMQSMGFGLPAAIGAGMASPGRKVICVTGDGCFRITAMELTVAVREKLDLAVMLFSDGQLGSIRLQQFSAFGVDQSVSIGHADYAALAESLGVAYLRLDAPAETQIKKFFETSGVRLLEVRLEDSGKMKKMQQRALLREKISNSPVASVAKGIRKKLKKN
jgi:acetolactate synthase-1/2/3 large subunit